MLEQLLGTTALSAIIIFVFYTLFYKLSCKLNLKKTELDATYIGDYAASIIVFMAISSLTLLIIVYMYMSWDLPEFLSDSGIVFAIIQFASGLFIRFTYWMFFTAVNKLTKSSTYHKLTPEEFSWTILMLCSVYGIVFLIEKQYTISFTYIVIVISYFFWLDVSNTSLKEKISSIKNLSLSYWYVIVFIGVTSYITLKYKTKLEIIFAIIGMFLGIFFNIIYIHYSHFKHNSSYNQNINT